MSNNSHYLAIEKDDIKWDDSNTNINTTLI